jgi:hypothetical protein
MYETLRWNGGAPCVSPKGRLLTWVGMQNFGEIFVHYPLLWYLMHNSPIWWDLTCNPLLAHRKVPSSTKRKNFKAFREEKILN